MAINESMPYVVMTQSDIFILKSVQCILTIHVYTFLIEL